jgi:hypothetical protein
MDEEGTRENPLLVWQTGYGCGHATLNPQPIRGQYIRRVGFLDTDDKCPACKERARSKRAAKKKES